LPPEIMSDALHPSALGYRLWAEGMEESVRKLLGE
jgi:lysophospholipase L1-like esterase